MNEESLFQLALEKPAGQRAAFLSEACGHDAAARQRIEALLKAHDNPGSFLAGAAPGMAETIGLADDSMDRAPPTLPGDYEIVRELGRGGMGVVYLAKQKSLGREVAVKVLRPGEATFGPLVKRFLEEARHLAQLRHPNIVSIHEIGRADKEPYFTMDYVEGEPLSTILARSRAGSVTGPTTSAKTSGAPALAAGTGASGSAGQCHPPLTPHHSPDHGQQLAPTQALAILKQAAAGVQHAHEHGIIHRDLKPANILVDSSGHAYVTDFGLARDMAQNSKLTRSGEVMGTPAYMSPEQVRGQKELIGEATDVHALGVILYEMLTGQLPYGSDAPADVIVRLMSDEPTPPRKIDRRIPRDLETICLKAMAKAPDRRYANVKSFLEDIRRFESGEPVLARRPSRLFKMKRVAQRHWKIAAAAVLAAGIATAVAPRLFDKSVEELIAWGDEQIAAGEPVGALRVYARAYRKANGSERRTLLPLMLTAARNPAIKDQKQVGESLWDIVDIDPEISLQEFDYPIMEAWGQHHGGELASATASDDEKRRMMELGEKRIQLIINGGYATEAQRKEAEKQLALVRFGISHLKTGSSVLFEVPIHDPPAELLRRAAASSDPKLTFWTRGIAAFGAGIQLEANGDKPGALAAYRQAYDLMRSASPTYSGLSRGIDMNYSREKQHESQEPRLLREVVRAVQRLDPIAPDPLRGGIRFRVVGPQIPKNEVIKLYALLWDPAIKPMTAGFGTRPDAKGTEFPQAPGSFPIQIDGTAWIGVADGKYRLAVMSAEWGGTGPRDPEAPKQPVELDFNSVPAEVEIQGQTVELKIRSYQLETINLSAPADGESIDLRTATFRWQGLPRAKHYWIEFGYKEKIPGGIRTNFIYDAKTAETSFSLANLSPADAAKFKPLKPGVTGDWGVTAFDADGQKIGTASHQEFKVARELEQK
jgi:serine/threonine protein kinase